MQAIETLRQEEWACVIAAKGADKKIC